MKTTLSLTVSTDCPRSSHSKLHQLAKTNMNLNLHHYLIWCSPNLIAICSNRCWLISIF